MIKINVTSNFDQIALEFNKLGRNINLATKDALNRTAIQARTKSIKELKKDYAIKSKHGKNAIDFQKASDFNLTTILTAKGKPLPISRFSISQKKSGTLVQINKGKRKTIKHSFVATMKSGHQGVYKRVGKSRLPIKELFTLSLAEMFGKRKTMDVVRSFVRKKFPEILTDRIKFYSNRG